MGHFTFKFAAAIFATFALCLAGIAPALARTSGSSTELLVDGVPLGSSELTSTAFTLTAAAPAGSVVKFKLDGVYLGQDRSAPYSWPISTTVGQHEADARWEILGERHEVESNFVVVGNSQPSLPSSPPVTPAPPSSTVPPVVPTPPPAAIPADDGADTVYVSTSTGLVAALGSARQARTIVLRDGLYVGTFVGVASGTATAPITLTGSSKAILSTGSVGSGYGLHITGSYWHLRGFSVAESAKGVVLDGSRHTVIDGISVYDIGAEGVHFRHNSSDSSITGSSVHDTGLRQPAYGEGIYIGSAKSNWAKIMGSKSIPDASDRVQVVHNRVANTSAEGIDVKEGTTGGAIIGNVFANAGYSGENYADSWVDMKGNGYTVTGNSGSTALLDAFQVHKALSGWGQNNFFSENAVTGDVPGYLVRVQSTSLDTVVMCEPTTAGLGLSNVSCTTQAR